MHKKRHRFATEKQADFFLTLRKRVNSYFQQKNLPKHGNAELMVKSTVMFLFYLVPFVLLLTLGLTQIGWVLFLWALMGLGMTGIGVNIMHDANHGSFSANATINKIMGYSLNILGGSAYIWKLQHNVMHHTYTNVHGADEDINAPAFLFRFSPEQRHRKIHKFQAYYAWFFYSLMSLSFVSTKDFKLMKTFRNDGLIKSADEYRKRMIRLWISKIAYYGIVLVLPMMVVPVSPWITLAGFLLMHAISGLLLSLIFQAAHIMPACEFPVPNEDGKIDHNWAVHQLMTTTNFSPKSRIFSWFIGGLNYQVEHHLFANISHVHYKRISAIVEQTAREFGVPYHSQPHFFAALWQHAKMLHHLGNTQLAVKSV